MSLEFLETQNLHINNQSSNYVLTIFDPSRLVIMNLAVPNTVTIPNDATVDFLIGARIYVQQIGVGQTSIVGGIGVTLNSQGNVFTLAAQYSTVILIKTASNTWTIQWGISKNYGSFYDTTTQTSATSTPTAIKLNTTDFVSGFIIENDLSGFPTRIKALHKGKYDLQFSAQLNRISGGSDAQTDIWIKINNNNVSNSNTAITMKATQGKVVAAWNFFVSLNANDYVQLYWAQNDNIDILYEPENLIVGFPATPSVIATISQVD